MVIRNEMLQCIPDDIEDEDNNDEDFNLDNKEMSENIFSEVVLAPEAHCSYTADSDILEDTQSFAWSLDDKKTWEVRFLKISRNVTSMDVQRLYDLFPKMNLKYFKYSTEKSRYGMLANHIRQFIGLKKKSTRKVFPYLTYIGLTNYFILYIMFVGHILYLNCIVPSLIKRCNNSFLYVVVYEDCDCSYNLI